MGLRDGRWSLTAEPDFDLSTDNLFHEAWIPAIKAGGYIGFRLYDLDADPAQQHDVGEHHPQELARLRDMLLRLNASIMADAADWHVPGYDGTVPGK